jgi:hypothetical protein
MSIRLIAFELYKIMNEVEALEIRIQELPPEDRTGRETLGHELRRAKAKQERIRKSLEGTKAS